jgi:hypothetical protein
MNDLRKNKLSRMSPSSNSSTTPPLIRPVKQSFKPMVAAIVLLALGGLAGTAGAAPISFSVTGTAKTNLYGYVTGQSYTFNWIMNVDFTNNASSFFNSVDNYWSDELVSEAPIFTDVSGDGLTGSWQRPIVAEDDPYSVIEAGNDFGTHHFTLRADTDGAYSIGLQANGTDVVGIEAAVLRIGNIFSCPGSYTDPTSYFAGLTGTYTPIFGLISLYTVNPEVLSFTPTSVTISAIPEPSTAFLTGLGLVALFFHRRRRAR